MLPHLGVHGGREQHRTARGQQGGGQQIIGPAGDGAGQHIGGGRRHDHQIRLLADAHMRHLVDVVENPGVHRETRQCLEVAAPTNRSADSVGTTRTWWPASVSWRTTEQAL